MTVLSYHATAKIVNVFPKHQEHFVYQKRIVQEGDTLWKYAATSDLNLDPRIVVNMIMEHNELTGALIRPGEVIYIPIAKSKHSPVPESASVTEPRSPAANL